MLMNRFKPAAMAALAAALLGGYGMQAQAQSAAPGAPAVFYTPGDLMRSVHRQWYAPQSAAFAAQSAALTAAVSGLCSGVAGAGTADIDKARSSWKASASAWDTLAGVQIGPLVQRRSARQIDFMPTRPELIKRAIEAEPTDAKAMESVGTPAKGLPALEWLLWSQPPAPATPACAYALQVATDIQREADALANAFAELAARQPGDAEESNVPAVSEFVNQWTGAIERLRWAEMEKPRLAGATGQVGPRSAASKNAAVYARSTSGQTAERWASLWQSVRTLAVGQGAPGSATATAPQTGGGPVTLDRYMRGLGRDAPAAQLVQSIAKADKALQKLSPANTAGVIAAARTLAEVKKVAEADVATAMEVSIGFSDADGD